LHILKIQEERKMEMDILQTLNIQLYTIGFTKKNAETFFNILKSNGIKVIIDIRLNNVSQLAGFAKKDDLIFFLRELCNCDYRHETLLAPTKTILESYKKKEINWEEYKKQYIELIKNREAHNILNLNELDKACLLCSEPTAEKCHRRLAAEYFSNYYKNVKIIHL
jgi:uncharacterized protein (DUF488 family)